MFLAATVYCLSAAVLRQSVPVPCHPSGGLGRRPSSVALSTTVSPSPETNKTVVTIEIELTLTLTLRHKGLKTSYN